MEEAKKNLHRFVGAAVNYWCAPEISRLYCIMYVFAG